MVASVEAAYCIGANNQKTTLHWCRSTLRYSLTLSEASFCYLQDNEVLSSWWTGATDIGREGKYYWAGSLDPVEDFVWSPGQPNAGADANCLILYAGWGYLGSDVGCDL